MAQVSEIFGQAEQAAQKNLYEANDNLDKTAFLELLVTQLKYQDPLNPMENQEFVAQLAQFSSLEQMQNLNENFSAFQSLQSLTGAAALIGKKATVNDTATGKTAQGQVQSVLMDEGKYYVQINGMSYSTDSIIKVEPMS